MPGKRATFTPLSILFRPHHSPHRFTLRVLVEAPGTAPGSSWLIVKSIYHHSLQADLTNIVLNYGNDRADLAARQI